MRSEVQDLVRSGVRPRTDLRRVRGSESGLLRQTEGSLCRQEGVQCSGPDVLRGSGTGVCPNVQYVFGSEGEPARQTQGSLRRKEVVVLHHELCPSL